MPIKMRSLTPAQAAEKLGVSAKALRLYEERELLAPSRTKAGWRCYGPEDMAIASEIVALRRLGLSLGQVERALRGESSSLKDALAAHEHRLAQQIQELQETVIQVRKLRTEAESTSRLRLGELADHLRASVPVVARFPLHWPWGGETFEVWRPASLTFIIGPLGSGKTRLAKRLAEVLPEATFLGLDRLANEGSEARARLTRDDDLKARVDAALNWLVDEGADVNDALIALIAGLEAKTPAIRIIDMVEQGLNAATQTALAAYLRSPVRREGKLFVLTRSSAILDTDHVDANENIILCPANHSPPFYVSPFKGAEGYEAVTLCLAPPHVRQRTQGVVAIRRTASA